MRRGGQDGRDLHRTEDQKHAEDAEHEAQIAYAVDDECLDCRRTSRGLAEPETDQKVGCKAHAFPAEEHLHEVVGRDQHQHREGEQREVCEKARLIRLLAHIAPAIEVNQRRNARHHHQHRRGQCVNPQFPVERQIARFHPCQHRCNRLGAMARQEAAKDRPGKTARHKQHAGGQQLDRQSAQRLVA